MIGYGQDVWCLDALQPGRFARGVTLVAQALYRRLITPRGMLRGGDEESAYGLDVSGYVGAVGYPTALAALPGLVRGELSKDDRVQDVQVTATQDEDPAGSGQLSITLTVAVTLADEGGDFTLTLAVNDAAVILTGSLP